MNIRFFKVFLIFILLGAGSYAFGACPIEKAKYKIENGDYEAGFRDIGKYSGWISSLALYIKSDKTDRVFWFLFDAGSANRINIISTEDVLDKAWSPPSPDGGQRPLGTTQYLAADSKDIFNDSPPTKGQDAPYKILIPDLPILLERVPGHKERANHAFFNLIGCST